MQLQYNYDYIHKFNVFLRNSLALHTRKYNNQFEYYIRSIHTFLGLVLYICGLWKKSHPSKMKPSNISITGSTWVYIWRSLHLWVQNLLWPRNVPCILNGRQKGWPRNENWKNIYLEASQDYGWYPYKIILKILN